MITIQGEVRIDRPVEEVFDFVADERNEPRYNPRMVRVEQISTQAVGRGAFFRAELRGRGVRTPMTIEFTDYERPRRLASSSRLSAMDIDGGLTFEPVPGATRLAWEWHLHPHGALRLMGPLIRRIGARQERECWSGLKRVLEGAATPVTHP